MPALNELGPVQRFFFARIFPWFIVLAGSFAVYLGLTTVLKAQESTDWPSVKGKIVKSGIRTERGTSSSATSSRNSYHADIVYEYLTGEGAYTGRRVSFGEYGREDEIHATQVSEKYPEGETVDVYYDPDQPTESVLEPGSQGVPWFFLALGFPILLFGGVLAFFLPRQAAKLD